MKAYQLIEKYGWIQKNFGNCNIGFCLLGAIAEAYGMQASQPRLQLYAELKEYDLTAWNDAPGRTKEEVIAVLRNINI